MVFKELDELQELIKKSDIKAVEKLCKGEQPVRFQPTFIRTALMLSAHKLKHLNKLDELEADVVILNLEDGVAPAQKPMALRLAALFLSHLKRINSLTVVRINSLDEGGDREIDFLNQFRPDAIRVPKIRSKKDVEKALTLIDPKIKVHLSIETKEAWQNLSSLRVESRVEAYYLGILDLLADMGLPHRIIERSNPTIDYILAHFLTNSLASNVLPVSFVFQDHNDNDSFKEWCRYEKSMGFHAKGCISPTQVNIANSIFQPEVEEIERAREIVKLFEAKPDNSSIVSDIYGFVDEPIYKGAKRLLESID
ncbi:HpcH/HpaI aldolase/citrate lyase family protein [Hydrogenimonas thermophila]|uniref:Citrate lyase subunit beta / citryl-CoA lyase n=1 Tax=Hydrogenimonas thermophila TaxID=223786 RepID=A0A1I5RXC0_9BACT|nr:aldolase/citrate lyase family protein [Hydrogenimonas thermophila]SFP63090.1 citrate lyase subunit beta / citryl-CoA lyase [Hydrogenimonas thermophila]